MVTKFRLQRKANALDVCWYPSLIGLEGTTPSWQRFWQPLSSGHAGWCSASGGCRYTGSIGQFIELLKQCLRGKLCYRYCSFRYQY
jgi:hypothetical protein